MLNSIAETELLICSRELFESPGLILPQKSCQDDQKKEQDGPSLESSSYLNVTLIYVGPLDLGTVGPWDAWIL